MSWRNCWLRKNYFTGLCHTALKGPLSQDDDYFYDTKGTNAVLAVSCLSPAAKTVSFSQIFHRIQMEMEFDICGVYLVRWIHVFDEFILFFRRSLSGSREDAFETQFCYISFLLLIFWIKFRIFFPRWVIVSVMIPHMNYCPLSIRTSSVGLT